MTSYPISVTLKEVGFMQDIILCYPYIKNYQFKKDNFRYGFFDQRQIIMTRSKTTWGFLFPQREQETFAAPSVEELLLFLPEEIIYNEKKYFFEMDHTSCNYTTSYLEKIDEKEVLTYETLVEYQCTSPTNIADRLACLWMRLVLDRIIENKVYKYEAACNE